MKFSEFSKYLEKLQNTNSRLSMTEILAELLSKLDIDEVESATYLLSGKLKPNYVGLDFNIAEKLILQAVAKAYNQSIENITKSYKDKGELGGVVESFAKGTESSISILMVYEKLFEIASESGEGSVDRKIEKMANLLSTLDALSASFVVRIPVGNLRLGFSDMTVLDAFSMLVSGDKSSRKEIENAFNVSVDLGKLAKRIKLSGIEGLKEMNPDPGTPIRPSLAERLPSVEKILEKIGPTVAVEPKYDGFRAQVHIFKQNGGKKVVIYSRNLENTTDMFPDLVEELVKINVDNAIFDGEAIGVDPSTGKFLLFQETVQRKRKHGIDDAIKRLPLKYFVFDCLFLNGKSLLNLEFSERRNILEKIFSNNYSKVELTRQVVTDSSTQIRDLIQGYLKEGLEGALIKKLDATYKAGGRGYHWVKYKKTTEEGVADTIDCLVMGTYVGKGKRVGFGVGAFLVGILDGEEFKTVSKVGTGLTDEQWRELKEKSKPLVVSQKPNQYVVDKNLFPDEWMSPSLVVEILSDEITKSPIHSSGLALRFPRLIKFRDEKSPEDATSLKELNKLFLMQKELTK